MSLTVCVGGPNGRKRRKSHGLPVAGERCGSSIWRSAQRTLGCEQLSKPYIFRLNALLQFRILSKAASVVRDVTINLVDRLQTASQESSQKNRFVLC